MHTSRTISLNDRLRLPVFGLIFCLWPAAASAAGLSTVDLNSQTLAAMVAAFLGPGITATNITYSGDNSAAGTFSGGTGIIGFPSGLVLSSGNIDGIIGPNVSSPSSTDFNGPGDPDLDILTGVSTHDAAVLEFDFVPSSSSLSFNYVFGSEEYPDFVGSFNDGFALFVNGVNVALVPGTSTPVTINNVNSGVNSSYFVSNNPPGSTFTPLGTLNTQLNGLTTVLTATASVNPGVTNHIKIAIADAIDGALDSAVMLQANSFVIPTATFTPSPPLTPTPTFSITLTPTHSDTSTPTPSFTASFTPTISQTFSVTQTFSITPTFSMTPTVTPTPTITPTFTPTPLPLRLHLPPASPDPATGGQIWLPWYVSTPSDVDIEIFDIAGERVRSLPVLASPAGTSERVWDLKNDSGQGVGSGIFIYRVRAVSARGEIDKAFAKCAVAK